MHRVLDSKGHSGTRYKVGEQTCSEGPPGRHQQVDRTEVNEPATHLDGGVDDPEEVVQEVREEQVGVDGVAETPQVPARWREKGC